MADPYLGQLMLVGFGFNNRGWNNCDGQLLPISQYSALFSLFGTMYGGDGRTTFGLPDLRGRVAIHVGTGPGLPTYRQGQRAGEPTVTLNITQIPSHNHALGGNANASLHGRTDQANAQTPTDTFLGGHEGYVSGQTTPNATLHANSVSLSGTTENNGGSREHDNMQPYLVLRYLVAMVGIYPSRS